ncbi:hypothetical protein P3T76_001278 [Phytophthora citrophthora]|uniref:Uncharacterized protein n=1 Tax=Phytophthora citrophthora TaxID=4793 RepID=A0AAD9H035_9STRA|nr:hypothetical protein P3T76_001278 [Phytophthora citrophthora]
MQQPQSHKNYRARSGPDALGLANIVDPFTFLARKPSQYPDERSRKNGNQNPRRRRLRGAGRSVFQVTEFFSPQKSLRLAKLPLLTTKTPARESNQCMTRTPIQIVTPREPELPVHELIQTVDDAVKADPLAELNQSAIARLFMDQWLQQFEADRRNFKSVAVRYEVGFEELQRRTVNLPRPNELITSFCCKVLEDLTPHFGPYAPLFRVLSAELIQSIYARDGLPYFALVNHHKRLLLTLRKDKEWREERNEVLADDIENVYSMFRHFLSECTDALSRLHLHEWYSIVIVQKKNNRKYVAYFSNWFTSAPKAILRKVYVAWKREAALHRIDKIRKQMQVDLQGLTVVKRLADELTKQRDIAEADNLVMRNDRKQAEEWAKNLELRIKATSTYLDTTRRREAQVCQEGQLRVEAVACLPPLILESLLRGYHGVGFLQQASVPETDSGLQTDTPEFSLIVLECMAEISRLQNALLKRKSTISTQGGRSNSVVGRSNSVVIGLPSIENIEQSLSPQAAVAAAAAATTGNLIGRRAGGAISQDELSGRAFAKLFTSLRERIQTSDAKVLFTQLQDFTIENQSSRHENASLAREYQQLLRAIRCQDEHYASHSKLFSSRMLESHEISLVPNRSMPNITDEFAGSDKGDLGVINGVKRFWKSIVSVQKPKSPPSRSQLRRISTRMSLKERPQPLPPLLENLSLIDEADFDISPLHSRGFSILLLAHIATEYGALLFSPADMSAFTHNAYMNPPAEKVKTEEGPSPIQSSTSIPSAVEPIPTSEAPTEISNSLRIIQPVVTAYNTWNEISEQLISAGVVPSRGLSPRSLADPSHEGGGDLPGPQGTTLGTPIRPMLQHQFEPLSHSSFLAPTREKNARRTSISGGDGNTYHSACIRHLTTEGTNRLAQSIEAIHNTVKATTEKMKDFRVTRHQLRDLRGTQWQQATELALQFAAKQKEASVPVVATSGDHREHVYECISLANSTMRRIFSVEENPEVELSSVKDVFEKHQRAVRQLYTPFRANIKHAMSLDDLWHIVKIVRLPREIHVLPILRDEELVANGYEQLFSPEDLAELFLQLCNEQFQPQITPLSSRVEYFIIHHLTVALQNQSLLRPLMHRSDVKLTINSHSQTIRIIFRRYCAKERELMMPAVGVTKPKPRHTGHGITKYMRMVDWQAFVQDYHLIRGRLSMEQALSVFRNVQEAPPGSDDQLELIYSEFCEALVGVASFYFPDPYIKTASKVTQFLRRYLPLSPEDAHDHA